MVLVLKKLVVLFAVLALANACWAVNVLVVGETSFASVTDNLVPLLQAAGNTVTLVNNTIPSSLAGYQQIWDVRVSASYPLSATEITNYVNFMNGGGTMFVMGENLGFMVRNNTVLALIAAAGGGTLTMATGYNDLQTVLAPFTGPNAVTQNQFAAAGQLTSPGTGQCITSATSGVPTAVKPGAPAFASADGGDPTTIQFLPPFNKSDGLRSAVTTTCAGVAFAKNTLANARAGALSVIFDINFMQNQYDVPNSQNLLKNLMGWVAVGGPPPAGVPLPPSILLICTGLGGAALLAAKRRFGRR